MRLRRKLAPPWPRRARSSPNCLRASRHGWCQAGLRLAPGSWHWSDGKCALTLGDFAFYLIQADSAVVRLQGQLFQAPVTPLAGSLRGSTLGFLCALAGFLERIWHPLDLFMDRLRNCTALLHDSGRSPGFRAVGFSIRPIQPSGGIGSVRVNFGLVGSLPAVSRGFFRV